MGDTEFASELLAALLTGPLDKKRDLDFFYQEYASWPRAQLAPIRGRFTEAVRDIVTIFSTPMNFSTTRFRQKADFYSLFVAIDALRSEGHRIDGIDLSHLQEDLKVLDFNIRPTADAAKLREYAVHCVSDANSAASRNWRARFLTTFLAGSYRRTPPDPEDLEVISSVLGDLANAGEMCPPSSEVCPICNDTMEGFDDERQCFRWRLSATVFQMSNAVQLHRECLAKQPSEWLPAL